LPEYGNNPKPRGPLNWEWVHAIIRAIDKYGGGLSSDSIEQFTRDVYLYTRVQTVRDAVDAIVRAQLNEKQTIVVAHSLGTIVAYNVLRADPRALSVPLLTTVGSPLGIRAVRDQLLPLSFPAHVRA
jgi:pimeloyl-ACP methyl ester carboxylesterase